MILQPFAQQANGAFTNLGLQCLFLFHGSILSSTEAASKSSAVHSLANQPALTYDLAPSQTDLKKIKVDKLVIEHLQ